MSALTHGDLFAGIGGFSLGFQAAGFDTRWHVQWEPDDTRQAAQQVLRRHWPDVPLFGDVRECGTHNLAPVDVLTFGSPCQDLSVAGKRRGLEGDRSVLFYEALRIVAELKPTLAIWENVDGALSSHAGRDFASVLLAFQELGARDIGWTVLNAQYFGVPQKRRRVFLVADFRGERTAEILFESDRLPWDLAARRKTGSRPAATLTGGSPASRGVNRPGRRREDDVNLVSVEATLTTRAHKADRGDGSGNLVRVASTLTSHHPRMNGTDETFVTHALTAEGADASEDGTGRGTPLTVSIRGREGGAMAEVGDDIAYALTNPGNGGRTHSRQLMDGYGVRRLTPTECERLQGFPDHWTALDADGKAISDSARYRMLGNAVVVPVVEWLATRIAELMAARLEEAG